MESNSLVIFFLGGSDIFEDSFEYGKEMVLVGMWGKKITYIFWPQMKKNINWLQFVLETL